MLPSPTTGHVWISRWDGTSWQVIGTSSGSTGATPNAEVRDLEVLPDGTLVAVGTWLIMNPMGWPGPGGYRELVAWNGASWDHFHNVPEPEDLVVGRRGDLYLVWGGSLSWIDHWSGGTWHGIGTQLFTEILTVAELPNGDLVAGGLSNASRRAANGVQAVERHHVVGPRLLDCGRLGLD